MPFNGVAFKKSMLSWDGISKKAQSDILPAAKKLGGDDPKVAKIAATWGKQIADSNTKLRDLLDKVINAKDDKARADAAKNALSNVKQYQNFVTSSHFPPEIQSKLKAGLAELAKGLS